MSRSLDGLIDDAFASMFFSIDFSKCIEVIWCIQLSEVFAILVCYDTGLLRSLKPPQLP